MKQTNREKHENAMITKEVFKAALVYVGAIVLLLVTVSFCAPATAEEVELTNGWVIQSPERRLRGVITICVIRERRTEPFYITPLRCFDALTSTLRILAQDCIGTEGEGRVQLLHCEDEDEEI